MKKGTVGISALVWAFSMLLNPLASFGQPVPWLHISSNNGIIPLPNGGTQQTASLVFDVDKDGKNDLIIGERTSSPSLVWLKRTGNAWTKHVIESATLKIEAGGAYHDIDGDGDDDIVFGGDYQSNQVWWWENPYPNYSPNTSWPRHIIKNSGSSQHHDELFGKFKGDGQTQLVFWNQGAAKLFIASIPANPRNDQEWPLATVANFSGEGLTKIDIDGDGTEDIVGGGKWFKYNGNGGFTANSIDDGMASSRASAGQLVAGGRPEVVFSAGDWDGPLRWYDWNGSSWVSHELLSTVVHGHSLQIADINGDGYNDIFSAEMRLDGGNSNAKTRVYYGNGQGGFTLDEIATGIDNHESRVADLDGDGDLDVFAKPYNWSTPRLDVLMNGRSGSGGTLNAWTYIQADASRSPSAFGNGAFGLSFGDLTGDGYKDIASGQYFYRNPGGAMTGSWNRTTLPNNSRTNHPVDAALLFDAEGTGQLNDIIAEDLPDVLWLRANDNAGTSWTPMTVAQVPATSHGNGRTVKLAHIIPSNTKPDILLTGGDGVYLMQIPSNPQGGNWPIRKITTSNNGEQKSIGIGDINRDGRLDIAVTVGADRLEVDWWSNPGNATDDWTKYVIGNTNAIAKMVLVTDVNNDGRLDVVVSEEARPASVYWFEAPSNPTTGTWTRHTIANGLDEIDSMSDADLNGDGRPDIIVGEIFGAKRLIIYENQNNGGSWQQHIVGTGRESHNGAIAVDLDNDNDFDIVSIAYFEYANMHVWRNDNGVVSAGGENTELPTGITLKQNYPNPFNPSTRIEYTISNSSFVTLKVSNALGQTVATLVNKQMEPGQYVATLNGANLPTGTYVYELRSNDVMIAKKMLLIR